MRDEASIHIFEISILTLSIDAVQQIKKGETKGRHGIGICKGCMQKLIYHCEEYTQILKDLNEVVNNASKDEIFEENI